MTQYCENYANTFEVINCTVSIQWFLEGKCFMIASLICKNRFAKWKLIFGQIMRALTNLKNTYCGNFQG